MNKRKIYYKNIFMYASLQFCGNIEEYFANHTKKLVVFIVLPRVKNKGNLLRIYENGLIKKEETINLSENLFMYYIKLFYYHWHILLNNFSSTEKFYLIAGHPLSFFALSLQTKLRRMKPVYWIGDYFPGNNLVIKLFELVKKLYHDAVPYNLYLSDGINKVFNNGKVVNTQNRKTVMWGVKDLGIARKAKKNKFNILFVGVIKESQGLEKVFKFLKNNKSISLNIVGVCDKKLYLKYSRLIKKMKISGQVNFPNKFLSDIKLTELSKKCDLGIAIYDTSISNPTYYTDPGKVKAYTQLGLPIIMSNTSGIAEYIRKFHCGEIINEKNDLDSAIAKISSNYDKYLAGIKRFNAYFAFEKYYREKFRFIEKS